MKIAVAGTGYVGLSNAILLAQHNEVVALDIVPEKVEMLGRKQSPIENVEIEDYLANKMLNLRATLDKAEAYTGADFVVIAISTNYDPNTNYFNTHKGIAQADARVISFAEIPLQASFPKKNMMLAVSVIGALFFAVCLVFVLEMLNPGVRSPEQIQELFNMSTLGIVPKVKDSNMVPHDYLLAKPQSSLAEAVNTLRISLSLLNPDAEVKSLLVTSAVPGEGKSTLATLVARHSARAGQRVVLVDTDLRRPSISSMFNLKD